MKRLSTFGLLVGCLALLSRGVPFLAPSASLAQDEGEIETTANEDAAEPDSGDEGGGAAADPHAPAPAANDDAEEDEPGVSTDENDDGDAGTDEAASRTPAWVAGGHGQDVEAM